MIQVDFFNDFDIPECPSADKFETWVRIALANHRQNAIVAIKIVDENESMLLNGTYRKKNKPTNVLSFPSQIPEFMNSEFLGDIAICAEVVKQEAHAQKKPIESHYAHLVVHGVLHLLGFDHENDQDAEQMESEEVAILQKLGFPDPYAYEPIHD